LTSFADIPRSQRKVFPGTYTVTSRLLLLPARSRTRGSHANAEPHFAHFLDFIPLALPG